MISASLNGLYRAQSIISSGARPQLQHWTRQNGVFNRKELHDFVFVNKLPLVIFYNQATTSIVFGTSIKKQILYFVKDDKHWGYAQPVFEKVARMFRGQGFVEAFFANKLSSFYKSEPLPKRDNGDVKIAVGKNFEEVVLDESKDTLLELYSPGCHYCQDLELIYQKLAKWLKSIPSISIVKMDGIVNGHLWAKLDGYPTILFFTQLARRALSRYSIALPRTANKSKFANKASKDIKEEL